MVISVLLLGCDQIDELTKDKDDKAKSLGSESSGPVTNYAEIKAFFAAKEGLALAELSSEDVVDYMASESSSFEFETPEDSSNEPPSPINDCFNNFYRDNLKVDVSGSGMVISIKGTLTCMYRYDFTGAKVKYDSISNFDSCGAKQLSTGCSELTYAMNFYSKIECVGGRPAEITAESLREIVNNREFCVDSSLLGLYLSTKISTVSRSKFGKINKELEGCMIGTSDARCYGETLLEDERDWWNFQGTTDGEPCRERISDGKHETEGGCHHLSMEVDLNEKDDGDAQDTQNTILLVEYKFPVVKGELGKQWYYGASVESNLNDWKGNVILHPTDGHQTPTYEFSREGEDVEGVVGANDDTQETALHATPGKALKQNRFLRKLLPLLSR
jgi:hypothetical protein